MKKMADCLYCLGTRAYQKYTAFKNNERGDTNFISIIIIVAIVVVFAGLFLAFGEKAISAIQEKVVTFINDPS